MKKHRCSLEKLDLLTSVRANLMQSLDENSITLPRNIPDIILSNGEVIQVSGRKVIFVDEYKIFEVAKIFNWVRNFCIGSLKRKKDYNQMKVT